MDNNISDQYRFGLNTYELFLFKRVLHKDSNETHKLYFVLEHF